MLITGKREFWLYLAALGVGVAAWLLIVAASGRNEAWDSPLYFRFGVPIVCLVAALLGFCAPRRSWRWGVLPPLAQLLTMLISPGPGNMLPLGIVLFGFLALPSILAARLGAYFGNRFADRTAQDE